MYAFVTQYIWIFEYPLAVTNTIYNCTLLLMKDFSLLLKHLRLCFGQYLLYCFKYIFNKGKISTKQSKD